ncbi:RNA polymerase subunit sigma-54 [Brevibacillus reuszeri]|uniref:HTH-type transcriptional regulatory protein TyrR n=1 Tax=Brevibacillus reuszeri TaxID=54915 RepID=A0A0K9YXW4_9BACL|nr:sigma 54-interacting transcriptional regulator [Brevibacillus reuszeri]KNB73501.1 Fis family transcriptional regulator [Brevibacillus reuszeri]MED1858706.1 sigma 54-interacting transcriptional regulator [Brevibacillus reuszeri]GED69686.1 RNA polymerase subunit sigma-54 [Brevibacillus reuszeri]
MEIKHDVFLQHIIQNSFDEIFVIDTKGNVIFVSPTCKEMFGIPAEEMVKQNVYDLEARGIFAPSVTALVLKTRNKETVIQDTQTGRKNVASAYPIFDEQGEFVGAVSFSRDITELEYLKKRDDQVAKTMHYYQKELEQRKQRNSPSSYVRSGKMEKVYDVVSKVAGLDVTVLLVGESGVGKNHLAQTIHEMSKRRENPFIEVNCGAIPETLMESELFGYEDGAFTGAKKGGRKGYFEAAEGGTIFLDEIAELPLHLQVKLLSVLQNQTITRVGGNQKIELKCRIICATNQNLERRIAEKTFREDLYYRINVIKIEIPPIRERREEMVSLIYDLTDEINQKYKMNKQFSTAMVTWLGQQDWPGNVRELRHFIEKTIITANDQLIEWDEEMTGQKQQQGDHEQELTLDGYMEMLEKDFILRMYRKYPSSVKLAEKLGISQSTANRKIRKYLSQELVKND